MWSSMSIEPAYPFEDQPFLLIPYSNLVACLDRFCMLGNEFSAKHMQPVGHFAENVQVTSSNVVGLSKNNCSFEVAPKFRRFLGNSTSKCAATFSHLFMFHNVLSMYESEKEQCVGFEALGRRAMLDSELHSQRVSLAGFCEARTKESAKCTEHFHMLSSGCIRGQLGCELWIAKKYPTVDSNNKLTFVTVQSGCINSFYNTPRILAVSFIAGDRLMVAVVFHAPHHHWPKKVRDMFWDELAKVLSDIGTEDVVLLGDANGLVGSARSSAVGNFGAEIENENGLALHKLCLDFKFCIPATFEDVVSCNSMHTFKNHRIDYICVPQKWPKQKLEAYVTGQLEDMAPLDDHCPTFVKVHSRGHKTLAWTCRKSKPFDVEALREQCNQEQSNEWRISLANSLRGIADSVPLQDNPDGSLEIISACVHDVLIDFIPQGNNTYVNNLHISNKTRRLASAKKAQAVKVKSLRVMFPGVWECSQWQFRELEALRSLGKQCKKSVLEDHAKFVEEISLSICEHDALHRDRASYRAMRLLEKKGPRQLPTMQGTDGKIVRDPIEVRKCFMYKVAGLTNGHIVNIYQLISIHLCSKVEVDNDDRLQLLELVPSQGTLESMCSEVSTHKSGGEDDVPGEILKYFPIEMAAILYPLVLQIVSECREPLAWIGGISHEILKSGGTTCKVQSYRMVLLADVFSKLYHKYLRMLITSNICTYMLDTMCGSFLRRGVDFANLYVAGFMDHARMLGHSFACVF